MNDATLYIFFVTIVLILLINLAFSNYIHDMKTKNDQTRMPSGSDIDNSGSELGDDQGNIETENKTNNPFLLGIGNRSNMGEVIMRWESSRYMI